LIVTRPSAVASAVVDVARNPNSFGSRAHMPTTVRRRPLRSTVRAADVARGSVGATTASWRWSRRVSTPRSPGDNSVEPGARRSTTTTSTPFVPRFDMTNNHRLIDAAVRE